MSTRPASGTAPTSALPNIGLVLAERLRRVGIHTADQLLAAGDEAAFEQLRALLPADACVSTRLALAGAVRGIRWHALPKKARVHLAAEALPGGVGPVVLPAGTTLPLPADGRAAPQRGDIWWTQDDDVRPVVVLGADPEGDTRALIVVHAARGRAGRHAIEIALGAEHGLPDGSVVRIAVPRPGSIPCTWLTTVPRSALLSRAGQLSPAEVQRLDEAVRRGGIEG